MTKTYEQQAEDAASLLSGSGAVDTACTSMFEGDVVGSRQPQEPSKFKHLLELFIIKEEGICRRAYTLQLLERKRTR